MKHRYVNTKSRSVAYHLYAKLFYLIRCIGLLITLGAPSISYGQTSGTACELAITTQPAASSAICARGLVIVRVSAVSNQPITYQWYKNGVALDEVANTSGTTSATLSLTDVSTASVGMYSVVVSTSCASLTSSAFNLNVSPSTHPDYNALADLFYATKGQSWVNRTNWMTNCDPCGGWFGVSCSQGRVTTLTLTENGLDGKLPMSFGDLSELDKVVMYYNWSLRGNLPSSLGNLKKLKYLNLQLNGFSGPIPESIGTMSNLQTLVLSGNRLTDRIPASLGTIPNLSYLDLSINPLGGTIPDELSTLTHLTDLSLGNCQLGGAIPSWIGNCENLRMLNLIDNALTGNVPTSFIGLKSLQQLEIRGNKLTGTFPDFLADLPNLYDITMGSNQFTGPIPSRLTSMTKLIFLNLDNNQFTGEIPRDFSNLVSLAFVNLSNNKLSGSLPDGLDKLTNLISLRLANNSLSGLIPNQFGTLQGLQELDLSNNQLSGSIPSSIGLLKSLYTLRLNANQLAGCIPATLSALCSKIVSIQNNPGLPNGGDWSAFCASGAGSYSGVLTTLRSGNWNDASIWSCGRVPQGNDDVMIRSDHTVLLNENMPEAACQTLEILGTFSMQGGAISLNGNRIVMDSTNVLAK